jgi:phosphoglycolate phosphatase
VIHSVVFDLDGTLVDSAPDILDSLRLAVAEAGISSTIPLGISLIGPPPREMLDRWGASFSSDQAELALVAFRRIYDSSALTKTVPYPGAIECLTRLRDNGCELYVATNKLTTPTNRLLERWFPRYFRGVCCLDSVQGRRLSKTEMLMELARQFGLIASRCVVIGDACSDLRAGREMGYSTMGVLWGYGAAVTLEHEQPNWMVSSFAEVAPLLLV